MFKTSWRFFVRAALQHRTYTVLNVLGLSIGLAVTLLVVMYLKTELTYDEHHVHKERIYRLSSLFYFENKTNHFAPSGIGLAPILQEHTDAIQDYVRLGRAGENVVLKTGTQAFYDDQVFYADTSYFRIFPTPFLQGDPRTAFNGPNQIVLTQSLATRLYGTENPMGRVVQTNNNHFVVTGVIEDLPVNSHIRFSALLSAFLEPIPEEELENSLWMASIHTYIRLKEGRTLSEVHEAFDVVHDKYMTNVARALESDYDIRPEPLTQIHYGSKADFDLPRGRKEYLYVFAGVGLLILALAMINYMNLATARAGGRAKEIGVRKVLGSTRRDLIIQLLIESTFLAFFALLLAVVIVEVIVQLPAFVDLFQMELSVNVLAEPWLVIFGALVTVVVGVLSGLYPALYLSKIPISESLKGGFKSGARSLRFRRFLVGLQFTISISVVALALLMGSQMDYMSKRYLGFNKEDVVLVPVQDTALQREMPTMLNELRSLPDVIAVSKAQSVPGGGIGRLLITTNENSSRGNQRVGVDFVKVDESYFDVMEMEFLEGTTFQTEEHEEFYTTVVVNRELVDYYGWTDPIGKVLEWGIQDDGVSPYIAKVVGVIRNVNLSSLHNQIKPMIFFYDGSGMGTIHIRVNSENLKVALANIEEVWNNNNVGRPFEFSFLDQSLSELYTEDRRQTTLISTFTLITILISCLGLLGLTSYTTQKRYKEIGVRKVLGATVRQIVHLLFADVAKLVGLAVIISIPLSYAVYHSWVSNFAYFAPLHWYVFLFTGIIASLIAYVIVSLHSLRAAKASPVDSLKHE